MTATIKRKMVHMLTTACKSPSLMMTWPLLASSISDISMRYLEAQKTCEVE